ncbi:hypothetical protein TREPR_2091 [Treponema primitia ZAS-2]|uniref:Uncharacterized protein n=1 Tax=Treponema primitia (strain ATCC BAA-887 / DSM 12427 / ZAS-2) TaxID=545694 RepID=F5YJP9_TREPZ|nr:hypothetical protein TREPR_2091 [Treponema primitia ZAS-2]
MKAELRRFGGGGPGMRGGGGRGFFRRLRGGLCGESMRRLAVVVFTAG